MDWSFLLDMRLLTGIAFLIGSCGYILWGLLDAADKAKETSIVEVFDLIRFLKVFVPCAMAAFFAGVAAPVSDYLSLVILALPGGFGAGSLARRGQAFDVSTFFRERKK